MLREFKAANREIALIHDEEIAALMGGNLPALDALEERLIALRKQRDTVAETLKRHMLEHGCA